MIDRQKLLADLKPLLRELENDLRTRCDEVEQINADLTKEYEQAQAANRAGITYEEWRADLITQVAVAWVLSSVFVRFLEDNGLISPPRISGPQHGFDGQGLMRARDERDVFFRRHPTLTDRDYLLAVFDDLAKLPGTKDVFGPHNPVSAYRNWLSGDAAQKLIEFFQKIDTDGTGEIIHDFADDQWDTRFLGDLYQDLSEAARKKYALLQTPIFVEEFILDRTLEPAINEFGLKDFKMIDPACGSGHFVLGSFARILNHWRKAEPGTNDRELVNRALASVHGVDLNPYAVAIARFRLLLVAMRQCGVTQLKDAPDFKFNLACGDSLLHGSLSQQVFGFHELAHHYQSEDIDELQRVLKPGQYHTVVANPPYVSVKDRVLSEAYRGRYPACYGKYVLTVPFMQRLMDLALLKTEKISAGHVGAIIGNSFMRQQFGTKLVQEYLPRWDLTHIIDTAGAYIPGHGTPTVILILRNRLPLAPTVRIAMGIRGEPATPAKPANGLVWQSILSLIDQPGSENEYITVADTPRDRFHNHPWSIGGGGAAELKETLDASRCRILDDVVSEIGIMGVTGSDDTYVLPAPAGLRRLGDDCLRVFILGEDVRDWTINSAMEVIWPYDKVFMLKTLPIIPAIHRELWPVRALLMTRRRFGMPMIDKGATWYEWQELYEAKLATPMTIAFANVATHNHFSLDRTGRFFNSHAMAIKLPAEADEDTHLGLLSVLNSSVACFWIKQIAHNKGSTVDQAGARQRTMPFEDFYEVSASVIRQFPVPEGLLPSYARGLDALASKLAGICNQRCVHCNNLSLAELRLMQDAHENVLEQMILLQEELDWECYRLYGLIGESPRCENPPPIKLGQRAFEIALARKMEAGEEETTWFVRHSSTPVTEIPNEWPEEYKQVVQKRIDLIESDKNIALIERPEYKRRWNIEPWDQQQDRALRNWLLDRLESYFDLDGRMNDNQTVTARDALHEPRLISVAKVSDTAKQDEAFMQVAELYSGRMDFNVANLVGELIVAESVPCLPILRYKPSGMDKRVAWERTWDLQRLEDTVDAIFEMERLKKIETGKAEEILRPLVAALQIDEQIKPEILREAVNAAGHVTEAIKQQFDPQNLVTDAARRAKQRAVGDIPVPPKYTSVDFLNSNFWRLRGKLDVPKERWVSFPHCEGEDGTLVIAWAGYDHLQLARAIAEHYEHAKEHEGRKLVPLLACIGQLIPWLKQWHNEFDPTFGTRMGDYFESYLAEESKALGMNVDQVMAWTPPAKTNGRGKRKAK